MFAQIAVSSLLVASVFADGHSDRQMAHKRQATNGGATVNTPTSLVVCQPALLSWSGGKAPYFPVMLPGNQASGTPLERFPQTSDTSFTWNVDIAAGTSVTFSVSDSSGAPNFAAAVDIQPGTSTSCIGKGAAAAGGSSSNSTASSPSSAAGGAASAASSAAGGAKGSAAGAASSAVSSIKGGASAAASAGSSAASAGASSAASTTSKDSGAAKTVVGAGMMVVAGLVGVVAML